MQNRYKRRFRVKTSNYTELAKWEKDFHLIGWENLTLFEEYLEMVIQYGFITMFCVSFPLGPLFSYLNNLIEIRIDAFKVLTQYKRPLPKKAENIGRILKKFNNML